MKSLIFEVGGRIVEGWKEMEGVDEEVLDAVEGFAVTCRRLELGEGLRGEPESPLWRTS